jgi:hypothetical protein
LDSMSNSGNNNGSHNRKIIPRINHARGSLRKNDDDEGNSITLPTLNNNTICLTNNHYYFTK